MKKSLILSVLFIAVVIVAFTHSGENTGFLKNTGGASSGYSGDPAGGNQNCTSCHIGNPAQMQTGWITSNIPVTGYVPNTTYTITATATGTSITKFGFQISPQNSSGTFLGTLVNTSAQTQLSSNQKYINHTSSGTAGSGSKTWTFNWTAPATGSGQVVFYGAFNLTNSGGNTSGDLIRLSTLTVNEDVSVGICREHEKSVFNIFPNPVSDYLYVQSSEDIPDSEYIISNLNGKQILSGKLLNHTTGINISSLPSGIYIFHSDISGVQNKKFIKQ